MFHVGDNPRYPGEDSTGITRRNSYRSGMISGFFLGFLGNLCFVALILKV